MTKVLLALGGTLSFSCSALSSIVINNQEIKNIATQAERIEYQFEEVKGQIELRHGDWIIFSVDNINLTKLGITNVEKLHEYNKIALPGFSIFADRRGFREDSWDPKKRNLGEEGWLYNHAIEDGGSRTEIYSAAAMWNDPDSNDLMLRLSYKVFPLYFGGKKTVYYNLGDKLIFT